MTDDYWGPEDDGEADRLRALLRRWVQSWRELGLGDYDSESVWQYYCEHCDTRTSGDSGAITHAPGCIVGDTLKELGE